MKMTIMIFMRMIVMILDMIIDKAWRHKNCIVEYDNDNDDDYDEYDTGYDIWQNLSS